MTNLILDDNYILTDIWPFSIWLKYSLHDIGSFTVKFVIVFHQLIYLRLFTTPGFSKISMGSEDEPVVNLECSPHTPGYNWPNWNMSPLKPLANNRSECGCNEAETSNLIAFEIGFLRLLRIIMCEHKEVPDRSNREHDGSPKIYPHVNWLKLSKPCPEE